MMLADQDSWDRYTTAQWLNMRRWLDRNPDDELVPEVRGGELAAEPARYTRYLREYLGWGVFALMEPDGQARAGFRTAPSDHPPRRRPFLGQANLRR